MFAHTFDEEPKSYVSVVEGIKLPVISCELISNAPPSCGVVSFTKSVVTATKELSPLKKVVASFVPVADSFAKVIVPFSKSAALTDKSVIACELILLFAIVSLSLYLYYLFICIR